MTDITNTTIYNDIQPNMSTEIPSDATEASISSTGIVNTTLDSIDIDEPPTKKCKLTLNDKPRLLEDRIGSILSCCICLDLSTLPIFQVKNCEILIKKKNILFLSVLMDILCVLHVLIIY